MKKETWQLGQELMGLLLRGKLKSSEVAQRLGCSDRSVRRYRQRIVLKGPEGLRDHRGSNYHKLTLQDELRIVQAKKQGLHRSARWVRDHLGLRVHEKTVWRVFVKHHLNRVTLPPIKPITRFRAKRANDLWQIDLMGKVRFPRIGWCHLVLIKDDRSRYLLAGGWFTKALKIHVFACLYRAFMRYGLPKQILCDRGSQFKSSDPRGLSDFEDYVARLGIGVIYGNHPRTKGKIERRFRFIHTDFFLEHLSELGLESLNNAWDTGCDSTTKPSTHVFSAVIPQTITIIHHHDVAARRSYKFFSSMRNQDGSIWTPPSAITDRATESLRAISSAACGPNCEGIPCS